MLCLALTVYSASWPSRRSPDQRLVSVPRVLVQRDLDDNVRRTHQGYRVAGRTPAKALYDLTAEQWLLPPVSPAAEEVRLAS